MLHIIQQVMMPNYVVYNVNYRVCFVNAKSPCLVSMRKSEEKRAVCVCSGPQHFGNFYETCFVTLTSMRKPTSPTCQVFSSLLTGIIAVADDQYNLSI